MNRVLATVFFVSLLGPALAQVSDDQISDAYKICMREKHLSMPKGVYWTDGYERCGQIETEWQNSEARYRLKQSEEKDKIDSVLKRLSKPQVVESLCSIGGSGFSSPCGVE